MVVQVGGSFAYLAGDGMLTFDDHVRTVGDLRSAIERTTNIPAKKQARLFLLFCCDCDHTRPDSSSKQAHSTFSRTSGGCKGVCFTACYRAVTRLRAPGALMVCTLDARTPKVRKNAVPCPRTILAPGGSELLLASVRGVHVLVWSMAKGGVSPGVVLFPLLYAKTSPGI